MYIIFCDYAYKKYAGGGGNILVMRQTKACTMSISQNPSARQSQKLVIKVKF